HKSRGVWWRLSQFMKHVVQRKALADLILSHRRERDIFLQQRPHPGPFRISVSKDELIVRDPVQEFLQCALIHIAVNVIKLNWLDQDCRRSSNAFSLSPPL